MDLSVFVSFMYSFALLAHRYNHLLLFEKTNGYFIYSN